MAYHWYRRIPITSSKQGCEPKELMSKIFQSTIRKNVIRSPKEYVVNLLADECSQTEEFAVNPMQNGLETIPLTWVFTVK